MSIAAVNLPWASMYLIADAATDHPQKLTIDLDVLIHGGKNRQNLLSE